MTAAPPTLTAATSAIAGQGLFTASARAARSVVLQFDAEPRSVIDLGLLNHSCDPNLEWADGVTLLARRDITSGEELTCDYSTAIDDPDFVMNCHCETYRCRQLIEGSDWQIPQLQLRYQGHWTPNLQRRITALDASS